MMRLVFAIGLTFGCALAQVPRIGVIDYYGLRKTPASRIQQELRVKPGDPLPPSKADIEERLESIDGIVAARVEAVCCEAGGVILFAGVQERGTPRFEWREPPASDVVLPSEIVEAYQEFLESYRGSASAEAAITVPPASLAKFAGLARSHFKTLREVLRESADADHRTMAAHLLLYAEDRAAAAQDLQFALRDPEEAVRQNALRSLGELAIFAAGHPESEIRISPTWPVEMLNSLAWRDRAGAMQLLLTLSENRAPAVLDLMRERAVPQLTEMARWNSLQHALPAYILLGRIAAMPDEMIQQTWGAGERERQLAIIEKTLKSAR